MSNGRAPKPVFWMGSSRKDLKAFPGKVQDVCGFALWLTQTGTKHPDAKPLKGFQGAGVLELVENYEGGTFRAVYTVRFARAVYLLHAFQKKSKRGVKTPRQEIELVKKRLKMAEEHYAEWIREQGDEKEAPGS